MPIKTFNTSGLQLIIRRVATGPLSILYGKLYRRISKFRHVVPTKTSRLSDFVNVYITKDG